MELFHHLIMLYDVTDSADIGSKGITQITNSSLSGVGNSTRTLLTSEIPKQGKQAPVLHGNLLICWFLFCIHFQLNLVTDDHLSLWTYFSGLPDFAEVYGFIGSVFDPETNDHVQKLKEMDPINFETVSWILGWNLSSFN